MPKQRKPKATLEDEQAPLSADKIAATALGLGLMKAKEDGVDPYEMIALLTLESLALLAGRDPEGFQFLIAGFGVLAPMRSAECLHSALAGVPPPSLSTSLIPFMVH
jgi:hypothetical protein